MASSFDLVSLADVKRWLDITGTEDDVLLGQLITQISRAILNVIDRPAILPQDYTDTYDGGNETSVVIRQWPVIRISSCTVDGAAIPPAPPLGESTSAQAGYVLERCDKAPPGTMQRLSLRGFVFARGIQNVVLGYNAGYQISGEELAVPATPPYSVSATAPYGAWASDGGVFYPNGVPLTAVSGPLSAGLYSVADGTYAFAQADAGLAVLATYGYVPADLASCCMDWVAERYAYRSRIGQQSKSLGGQETVAFILKDIPDFAAHALLPYRRIVMP